MNFNDIMEGFVKAQNAGGASAGLAYLNVTNAALSAATVRQPAPNQAMKGFSVREAMDLEMELAARNDRVRATLTNGG